MEKVCVLYQPPGEHNTYSNVTGFEVYCKFTSISQTYLTTESLFLATIVIIHGLSCVTKEYLFLRIYFIGKNNWNFNSSFFHKQTSAVFLHYILMLNSFLLQIVKTLCLFLTPAERKCSRLCEAESSFKYESGLFVQGLLKVESTLVTSETSFWDSS